MRIKLPEVSLEQLEEIILALKLSYDKRIKKAQRASRRTVEMDDKIRNCQTILQEMLAVEHHARNHDEKASAIIR